jgi:hypothetical protein
MKSKRNFAVILGMVLTAGVFLAGCVLTTDPNNTGNSNTGNKSGSGTTSNSGVLDGTWKYESFEIIIDGDSYTMKYAGTNYGRGTIIYSVDNSTFTFRSTHEWTGSSWSPARETTNGKLTYSGNTLTISTITNPDYTFLVGTWTRQTGGGNGNGTGPTNTNPKTITITSFPVSAYRNQVAMVMLYSSFEDAANEEITAVGGVEVAGATLTFLLYRDENLTTRWNGTGDYIIVLVLADGPTEEDITGFYIYSNGAQINSPSDLFNVPMYSITETTSTIPFDKFYDVTDMM